MNAYNIKKKKAAPVGDAAFFMMYLNFSS